MDLNDPRVKAKLDIILPALKREYFSWLDSGQSMRAGEIERRLSNTLDKKGILVNSLSLHPNFELFFGFWVNDFESYSYKLGLSGGEAGGLTVSASMVR